MSTPSAGVGKSEADDHYVTVTVYYLAGVYGPDLLGTTGTDDGVSTE